MTITPEQLAELKRLVGRLRQGRWRYTPNEWEGGERGDVDGGDSSAPVARDVLLEDGEFMEAAREAVPALISEVERLAESDATCRRMFDVTRHRVCDRLGLDHGKSWSSVEDEAARLRRFAPIIEHLAAQYAEHGNLDADMARIASGEAVPFVVLHVKGCNGRHDDTTRCQG